MSLDFVLSKEPQSATTDFHGQVLFADFEIIPKTLWELLSTLWPGHIEVSILKLVCSHHGCERCLGPKDCGGLEEHHLKRLLQVADRSDASNPSDKGKQCADNLWTVGLFGTRRKIDPHTYGQRRAKLYQKLDDALRKANDYAELERFWLQIIEEETADVLSETRQHATDLVLSGHLKSTAVLFSLFVQSPKVFMCSAKNTIDNLAKLANSKNRVIAKDKRNIAFLSVDEGACANSGLVLGPFDEIGQWLADEVPRAKPSPKLVAHICLSSWAKRPEEIAEGYNMRRLVLDLKRFVNLVLLEQSRTLSWRRRGLARHIANLKKAQALRKLSADVEQTITVKSELLLSYDRFLKENGTPNEILSCNGWKDVEDAKQWAWDFLTLIMSPIRPSSPVDWSKRLFAQCKSPTKNEAVRWVLAKRFTLGRWFCAASEWKRLGKINRLSAWLKHVL